MEVVVFICGIVQKIIVLQFGQDILLNYVVFEIKFEGFVLVGDLFCCSRGNSLVGIDWKCVDRLVYCYDFKLIRKGYQ